MTRTYRIGMEQPADWEADVVLADGGTMHVRPIRPGDQELIEAFHGRQSPESIYYRYFSPRPNLNAADLERLTELDYQDRMAFVGLLGDELVGVARYDRYPASSIAEVAFFTDDAQRGRGMATVLLEFLAAAARHAGLSGFVAQVLPQNRRMLSVFTGAGFEVRTQFADGVIEVELGIEPTDAARASIDERARLASSRSVGRLLSPTSIAVIGVSRDPDAIGSRVARSLLQGGFTGAVHPIGRRVEHVDGVPVRRSVLEVDDPIDVAVICVPAPAVREVVSECGRKHVHGLVIITAGFTTSDNELTDECRELVSMARRMGMRVVGPGSMGVINTASDVSMRSTFVDVHPLPGRIAVSSQSGTLGAAIIEHASRRGLGISTYVDLGDRADLSNNDLLQFYEGDESTDMVLLYLESFGNPANFSRITRRLARSKPVVAVRSGGPHRLDRVGGSVDVQASTEALLAQTGVIRVDSMYELFDVAKILVRSSIPKGPRLAVVANSPGPARLAIDATRGVGLACAESGSGAWSNPILTAFDADPAAFGADLDRICVDPDVDMVLAICTPPLPGAIGAFASTIESIGANAPVPVIATYLGLPIERAGSEHPSVPVFEFPESAVRALGRVTRWSMWRRSDPGRRPLDDLVDRVALRSVVETMSESEGEWLTRIQCAELAQAAGLHLVAQREVASDAEAIAAAESIGMPVVLKAGGVSHPAKNEAGGVAVDIHDSEELTRAYHRMSQHFGAAMAPAVVQRMVPTGTDVRVTLTRSDLVGTVLSLQVDRAYVDEPMSPALQVLPCSDTDAASLLERSGFDVTLAGEDRNSRNHLIELLLRLSAMNDALAELVEVELDRVIVTRDSAMVTDIRVRLGAPLTTHFDEVRHLVRE